jgi:hypothetical protein
VIAQLFVWSFICLYTTLGLGFVLHGLGLRWRKHTPAPATTRTLYAKLGEPPLTIARTASQLTSSSQ